MWVCEKSQLQMIGPLASETLVIVCQHQVGQKTVLVEAPGGGTKVQAVQTGLSDGKIVEIVSGLVEGQKVFRSSYVLPSAPKQGMTLLPNPGGKPPGGGPPRQGP